MPELDLPPGDYRERKPKGWRWKLPWSHDDDVKMPMLYVVGFAGIGAYVATRIHEVSDPLWAYIGGGIIGFVLGAMLMLAGRR